MIVGSSAGAISSVGCSAGAISIAGCSAGAIVIVASAEAIVTEDCPTASCKFKLNNSVRKEIILYVIICYYIVCYYILLYSMLCYDAKFDRLHRNRLRHHI